MAVTKTSLKLLTIAHKVIVQWTNPSHDVSRKPESSYFGILCHSCTFLHNFNLLPLCDREHKDSIMMSFVVISSNTERIMVQYPCCFWIVSHLKHIRRQSLIAISDKLYPWRLLKILWQISLETPLWNIHSCFWAFLTDQAGWLCHNVLP